MEIPSASDCAKSRAQDDSADDGCDATETDATDNPEICATDNRATSVCDTTGTSTAETTVTSASNTAGTGANDIPQTSPEKTDVTEDKDPSEVPSSSESDKPAANTSLVYSRTSQENPDSLEPGTLTEGDQSGQAESSAVPQVAVVGVDTDMFALQISGIPPGIHEDLVRNFFQSKRHGGEIEHLELKLNVGIAFITFKDIKGSVHIHLCFKLS